MNDRDRRHIHESLKASWSEDTCLRPIFNSEMPSANQCAQTAIVLQRRFGGDVLMTRVRDGLPHFYNRIDGQREDFTAEQFTAVLHDLWQVKYDDKVVGAEVAMEYTHPRQVENLERAFAVAYSRRTG